MTVLLQSTYCFETQRDESPKDCLTDQVMIQSVLRVNCYVLYIWISTFNIRDRCYRMNGSVCHLWNLPKMEKNFIVWFIHPEAKKAHWRVEPVCMTCYALKEVNVLACYFASNVGRVPCCDNVVSNFEVGDQNSKCSLDIRQKLWKCNIG